MIRAQYLPLALYTLISFAGYLSFGSKTPEFIASRPGLPEQSDIMMSIAQVGLFIGMAVTVHVSVVSNRDTILSLMSMQKKLSPENSNLTKSQIVMSKDQPANVIYSKTGVFIGFLCAFVPLLISAFIRKNAAIVISLVASVYTPYIIIIVPGSLISVDEFEDGR